MNNNAVDTDSDSQSQRDTTALSPLDSEVLDHKLRAQQIC